MEAEKIQQTIKEIEEEIKSLPYHKGTEHHIGKLKAKLAKLRKALSLKTSASRGGKGFAIKKEGDGTVVLVGFPSVGKSTLLNKLTKARSKVADYPFTTLKVVPGMLYFQGAKIQVLDVPGLIKGAAMGKGRGKEVLSVARVADLLVLIAPAQKPKTLKIIEKELYLAGVRLDEKKPEVVIEKRTRGGLEISGKTQSISKKTIKTLAQEFGILNAKISFKSKITQDQLIDVFLGNRVYVPSIKVLSKIDLLSKKSLKKLSKEIGKDCLLISAKEDIGLEELKKKIFEKLSLVRVYLRKDLKGKSEKEPLICKKGVTVLEAARKISEDLAKELKGAKIKGPSAAHNNQLVGTEHQLLDRDEVFFVKKR